MVKHMLRRLRVSAWLGSLCLLLSSAVSRASGLPHRAYLPLVSSPATFEQNAAIWPHNQQPLAHEVALFRNSLEISATVRSVSLMIFADTRYELWVDGQWMGRGPARFSRTLREYDTYALGDWESGRHVLAVLVQWAPNLRRSESTRPFLKAHVQGDLPSGGRVILDRSGLHWKGILSNAWRSDATPVHQWQLIGPTELLDLRLLAQDWYLPAYSDDAWPWVTVVDDKTPVQYRLAGEGAQTTAGSSSERVFFLPDQVVQPQNVRYQPRSIPFLQNYPITPTLIDEGYLSPERQILELVSSSEMAIPFEVQTAATFTLETLLPPASSPPDIVVNDLPLSWASADPPRPDVSIGSIALAAGPQVLSIRHVPADGLTITIPKAEPFLFPLFAPLQGTHAGRRLLLAQLVSAPGCVSWSFDEQGLRLDFSTLPAYVVLDLGRTIHGRFEAEIKGAEGDLVDVGWDERLFAGSRPLPYPGSLHPQWNQVDSWVLDTATRSISTLDTRSGRYILLAVWGTGPVHLSNLRIFEERYPLSQTGWFQSSDPLLDTIWQTGMETALPNMTDAYTDTPWRERGQWWGDAYVTAHVARVAFQDTRLLRRGIMFMADQYRWGYAPGLAPNGQGSNMLDYAMLWVHSLAEYLELSADLTILPQAYPVLEQFMGQLADLEGQNGLLYILPGSWSQTCYIDPLGYHSRYGYSTALNAMYASTLLQAADIAEYQGDLSTASIWREKASAVKTQLNDGLFLPDQQAYATTLFDGAWVSPTLHAQAWPLAYGIVPAERRQYVAQVLLNELSLSPQQPSVGMYGIFWVLQALGSEARIAEALDFIRSYYGYQLQNGATTWWERMDANLVWTQSLSHAWGGAPTWFLTTYVLGIRAAGRDSWEWQPALQGVTWASGRLPLADGTVDACWERNSCERYTLRMNATAALRGQVLIPLPVHILRRVSFDGQLVFSSDLLPVGNVEATTEGLWIRDIESGAHEILVEVVCRQ